MHTEGQINNNIGCNVTECKYHAQGQPYCTLQHINVVKNGTMANSKECTDCGSFVANNDQLNS